MRTSAIGWVLGLGLGALTIGAMAGCGDDAKNDDGTGTGGETTTTATGTGGGGTGGAGGEDPGPVETDIQTLSGDITWTVTFDDDAKTAGATDCSYTRHYEAVEDASAHWLCPSCEIMYRAEVEMTDGETTCYSQISTAPYATTEWLGYGNGTWYRGIGGPMSEQGTVGMAGDTVTTENTVLDLEAPLGGFFAFDVAGQFSVGTTYADLLNGFRPPSTYACGWTKSGAPEYTGNYAIEVGGMLPDGLFKDACDETVRLHDLAGTYLIVDMAAIDCPPCRSMAGDEEAFIADMAASGIEVRVVTLLAPSLADTLGLTTQTMLNAWVNKYELKSPVLGDRGWGLSMFLPAIGDQLGYPSWVLVAPNLEVLEFGTGYGTFAPHKASILAHAGQ